jgi:hypothetical protein
MTSSERSFKIGLQPLDILKFLEVSPIQCADTGASRCPQGFQLARILRLALLYEPQPIAQHFAGILVAPGLDEGLKESDAPTARHFW